MKKSVSKKRLHSGKENLGKYFISGFIVAGILFLVLTFVTNNSDEPEPKTWSSEADSLFVKSCYNKYRDQVKDDLAKQEYTKTFCRCMLEKIKSQYDEKNADKMSDEEAKQWGADCWSKVLNPNNLK